MPPGTSTAIVGESGSGKSTIFRLLFRFYDPTSGAIQIDNLDVHEITIQSLRNQFGVVPQDTFLFNETIMYNIKYSKPEASVEEVYEACKAASIHYKILGFPNGYQTVVGERGLRLSGGERQRVSGFSYSCSHPAPSTSCNMAKDWNRLPSPVQFSSVLGYFCSTRLQHL